MVETLYFNERISGVPLIRPWDGLDLNQEWGPSQTDDRIAQELFRLYDESVANSISCFERALSRGGLAQPVFRAEEDADARNLRGLMFDLLEKYGRHTGHAHLLRENVDGRIGEDVPEAWQPVGVPEPRRRGVADPQPWAA